jgi:hypothetical protein
MVWLSPAQQCCKAPGLIAQRALVLCTIAERVGTDRHRLGSSCAMADQDNIPKVDRQGTTILVPIGLVIVFSIIAALMFWPKGNDPSPQAPGSGMARPGAVK